MSAVLRNVAELELLQAPGLPFSVPRDLACRPALTGAAMSLVCVDPNPNIIQRAARPGLPARAHRCG